MYLLMSLVIGIVLPCIFFFYPKGQLSLMIYKSALKLDKVSVPRIINCFTPLYNSVVIRGVTGFSIFGYKVASILIGGAFVLGSLFRLLIPKSVLFQIIATHLLCGSVVAWWIQEIVITIWVCYNFNIGWKKWLCIIPNVCQMLILTEVGAYFKVNDDRLRNRYAEEEEANGTRTRKTVRRASRS